MIEPLLQEYRGAEVHFQKKDNGVSLEFTLGTGANKNSVSIFIAPDAQDTTTMTLEVSSIDDPTKLRNPDHITKKLDLIIEDIIFHIMDALKVKDKAKVVEKGKSCPDCKNINDVDAKFCKECGFNFSEPSTTVVKPSVEVEKEPLTEADLIKQLDAKYPQKFECELCEMHCGYKDPFILLLSDVKNLKEPFEKFDTFLRDKDLTKFSDYVYDFSSEYSKKYPKYATNELKDIAFCIFTILSFHILEKAPKKIRLTFAEKMKERLTTRFEKEHPSISGAHLGAGEAEASLPTIKTGTLHIEENRCPYCYKKFDERTLKLKLKGYDCECPGCGELL